MALSRPVGSNALPRPRRGPVASEMNCWAFDGCWCAAGFMPCASRVWGWCSFSILELSRGGGLFTPSEKIFMSARKMCICSHKNGKGILTYYRGGVLVGDGNRVGDLLPATHAGSVAPPRLQGARVWLWYCGLFGTDFRFSHCHALPSSPIRRWGVQRVVNAGA